MSSSFKVLPAIIFFHRSVFTQASPKTSSLFYCFWLDVTSKADSSKRTLVINNIIAKYKLRTNNSPKHSWPHSNLPQGSWQAMSPGATEHCTWLTWPQGDACFGSNSIHLNSAGSTEQGTCCSWLQSGMIFKTRTMQGPHSSPQVLRQLCPNSQVLLQGFWQANLSLCSRSAGWQYWSHSWPQSSFLPHGSLHPPSGASSKSSADDAWITFCGWFWQTSFKWSPKFSCSRISAMIFFQRAGSCPSNSVAFPIM